MNAQQRTGLVNLMNSILGCACCPPDIRLRAEGLLQKLLPGRGSAFADIFEGMRR